MRKFMKICVGSYEEIHDYLLHQYHVADFWKYLSLLNLWCFMLCVDECSNCTSEIIQLKEWKTWIDYMATTFGSFSEAVIGKNWVWKIFARCAARWQEFFWIELIMWRLLALVHWHASCDCICGLAVKIPRFSFDGHLVNMLCSDLWIAALITYEVAWYVFLETIGGSYYSWLCKYVILICHVHPPILWKGWKDHVAIVVR